MNPGNEGQPRNPPAKTLNVGLKVTIVVWLGLAVLGAVNHNLLPKAGLGFPIRFPPHLKYGYVMFNQSPQSVSVVRYQRAGEELWRHVSELVDTPAPFYKRSRVMVDIWATGFTYLDHLCESRREAQEALFRLESHVLRPPRSQTDKIFRCRRGQFDPVW